MFNSPVYKKDEVTIKSNYRPVSVLSTIPKLFERAKFDQLYHAFAPLFSDNMSGFLRGHSCFTALVKLSDDWRAALDKKESIGVVAIDLSKAFDSVCYNLLLAKLKAYGVRQEALELIQSYCLTDSNVLDAMGPTRTDRPCVAGFRRVVC